MNRSNFWVRAGVLLCLFAAPSRIAAQEVIEVNKVEYLQGVPGHEQKARGSLRISPTQIVFVAKGGIIQFAIEGNEVEYVAAKAQASMRARTADTGVATAGVVASGVSIAGVGGPLLGGLTLVPLLFHKAEKHLLSIEYLEGEDRIRELALFNVHDHSALAVKKMIDTRLDLTPDYYRNKDREEEERKREMEAQKTPAGYWEATKNTMVGDSQYERVLLEKGKYAVLLTEKYVGFSPEGVEWAKYRIPIRQAKPSQPASHSLTPIYKKSRLVGFKFDGKAYLFY